MYVKIHETSAARIVAACDDTLLGKVFREGKRVLDLQRYQAFYRGKKGGKKELQEALKRFSSANLVGKEATGAAIDAGFASTADLYYISKVPYLHIYKL